MDDPLSSTFDKMIEAAEPIEKPTETFHDIHDAIEKLEDGLRGHSHSHSDNSNKPISYPTLGELLHMKIT